MRYLKSILVALLSSAAVVAGIGFMLNPSYTIEKTIQIKAPADSIYPWLANVKKWPQWSAWNSKKDPSIRFTYNGPEMNVGAKQEWKGEVLEKGAIVLTGFKNSRQVDHTLQLEDDMVSKGTLLLEPQGRSTLVRWKIQGDAGTNLPQRYYILFIEKFTGPDMEEGLKQLKKISESR